MPQSHVYSRARVSNSSSHGCLTPVYTHAHVDKEFPTTNMFRVKVNFALRLSVIRQLQLPVVRGSPLFAVCNECRCRWGVTWTFLHSPNFNLICFDLQSRPRRLSVAEIPTRKKSCTNIRINCPRERCVAGRSAVPRARLPAIAIRRQFPLETRKRKGSHSELANCSALGFTFSNDA